MEAVAKQPVSVAIEGDTLAFQMYTRGVLTSDACGTSVTQLALAVGYGSDNGIKYWKVKNSWGASWGEEGYIRIERGSNISKSGGCGILQSSSYPVVKSMTEIVV